MNTVAGFQGLDIAFDFSLGVNFVMGVVVDVGVVRGDGLVVAVVVDVGVGVFWGRRDLGRRVVQNVGVARRGMVL